MAEYRHHPPSGWRGRLGAARRWPLMEHPVAEYRHHPPGGWRGRLGAARRWPLMEQPVAARRMPRPDAR